MKLKFKMKPNYKVLVKQFIIQICIFSTLTTSFLPIERVNNSDGKEKIIQSSREQV